MPFQRNNQKVKKETKRTKHFLANNQYPVKQGLSPGLIPDQ